MEKIRLALLSGGISSERQVSINSGRQVFDALDKDKYDIIQYDPKTDLQKLVIDADKIDAALVLINAHYFFSSTRSKLKSNTSNSCK